MSEGEPVQKKSKRVAALPSSVIVHFQSSDAGSSEEAASSSAAVDLPTIDLPIDANTKQLETLVNSLLQNTETLPYAFYVNDIEVVSSLRETIELLRESASTSNPLSLEETLEIKYQPLSVYRVRPVTRCHETMRGHTDAVLHVSYAPDGSKLASGGGDLCVRFWNVSNCMPTHTCTGHRHHVLCTAWSPNGEVFVSADKSGEIRVWDPVSGRQRGASLTGHTKWVTSLAFEPFHVNPQCDRLASASKDSTVKIWNIATGRCEATISGHSDSVESVKWGGAGLLYTCSRDRTIKVWAVDGHGRSQQKLVRTLSGHAHRINALALNCDFVCRTAWHDLSRMVSANQRKNQSSTSSSSALTTEEAQALALERYRSVVGVDGERLVSCSDDFTLFLWKAQEEKTPITRMTGHQQLVNHIAFSPDGRLLASASFDKKVKLWCGKTGRFLATLTGHVGAVYQVSWSADSTLLASASKDSTVKVWSVKDTKKALHTLAGHEDEVYALDWSPNGTQLASGSKDRTIKIWHH